jgi:branched-chain amino acid transport system substrate-binding protein
MKKNILFLFILAILAIFIATTVLNKNHNTDATYSIGAVVPLTGGAANIGSNFSKGMHMAVEEINKRGGINGAEVILDVQDSEFSGTKSISAINQQMITINPDVFDILFALPAQAVAPVLESAEKPFLAWDYSRGIVDNNAFAFKTGFDAKTGCEEFVRYAKNNALYEKLGVFMSKTPYNESCLEGIKKVEENVQEYWYDFGTSDFRTLLTKVHSDGVDLIATIPIDPEPIQIFQQINDLGHSTKVMCFTSSECIYDGVLSAVSPETLRGTLGLEFIPENLTDSEFAKKFQEKYPNASNDTALVWAAQGYDDVLIMTAAMKKCTPKDSKCLVKSLEKVRNYDSPIDSNGFNDRVQNLTMRKQVFDGENWTDLQ